MVDTLVWIFGQSSREQVIQGKGHICLIHQDAPPDGQGGNRGVEMLLQHVRRGLAAKERVASEQSIQQSSQCVHIGGGVNRLPKQLFWRGSSGWASAIKSRGRKIWSAQLQDLHHA